MKTPYCYRLPWDRAPLNPFESAVYEFAKEFHAANGRVPGKKTIIRHFGCSELAASLALRRLVIKGWLGEGGGSQAVLYFNDEPKD